MNQLSILLTTGMSLEWTMVWLHVVTKVTSKFQTLTCPPRQPDASSWSEDGWNVMHHGVRGWPLRVFTHLQVLQSTTRTVWSPWDEAILVLEMTTKWNVTGTAINEKPKHKPNIHVNDKRLWKHPCLQWKGQSRSLINVLAEGELVFTGRQNFLNWTSI